MKKTTQGTWFDHSWTSNGETHAWSVANGGFKSGKDL